MELFEAIRRDARREELGIRELARRYRVHRRTVRLACATPPERKTPVRRAPRLEPLKPAIDVMLREDLTAPRKQRHTARRVLARLVDEHGQTDLSYPTVRDYVARRRAEIALEADRAPEAFVPQSHEPGAEGESDFAELWVDLAGVRTKTFLFTLRLSYSGRAFHECFATQAQEAFLEGHVHAFAWFGGVPWDQIRPDEQVPAPDGWTGTFSDPRLCAAIIDRLTFADLIIETGSTSYRLAHAKTQHAASR